HGRDKAGATSAAAGQIGVYSDVNFAGSCLRLNPGKVTAGTLGGLNNKIASIQVSSGTCATLFDRDNSDPLGRAETFSEGDYNLADNRIGATLTSSVTVEACTTPVDEPFLTFPGNLVDTDGNSRTAPNPAGPTSADSLVLAWTGGEGSKGFTSSLILGGQTVKSLPQANTNTWSVGTLAPGNYTWRVTAQGDGSTNSTDLAFTVGTGALPAGTTVTAPQIFDMESGAAGWTGTGLWKLTGLDKPLRGPTQAWVFSNGTNFADATYRDLTSPPITIPAGGTYYLRFRSYSDVEGAPFLTQRIATPNWDQRRVQVSTDNGVTFSDLYQLEGDTQGIIWLDSPAINLAAYAGKTIRLRFHFDAVDGLDNTGLGWAVDDVRVDATAPDTCADNNTSPATAQALTINGAAASATICPGGDTDYYSFTGSAGTPVRINLDAKVLNAADPLDSFIALLDANGRDVLVLNDDEDPNNTADPFRDSLINTVLPRTGTYYVRVRAWDHPGAGGSAYTYKLAVTQIVAARPESVALNQPRDPKKLPVVPFIVEAAVKDSPSGGGIRQVDFYWHSADWENDSWVKFGSDTTSADGWWAIFDPSFNGSKDPAKSTPGSAFYILATNTGGGSNGLLIKDMQPDLTAPASALYPLPKEVKSTAVQLTWTAQDLQNDIDHFEFKYRVNAGAWTLWDQKPGSGLRSAWFISAPGNYEFQMQAVDQASNQEGFPGAAEAGTTLNGACTDDGNDQARTSALTQPLNTSAVHPLCKDDVDWVRFSATKDQQVFIFLASRSGGASMRARLTDESGATQYVDLSSRGPGIGLQTTFIAPADGIYYLEITPADARIYGQDVQYLVYLGDPHQLHLPVISR
ncbi:MAG TPA: pre-peptidase C-terminal domain-containing protein, partial [Anaerolinea sp.]|nr:pre-peptidase C-terminal domain-containing protein [Anaerolinea sp.]